MKTLRIHFGREDLTRVRLAAGHDAMWEFVLSVHQLAFPDQYVPFFTTWRRRAVAAVTETGLEATVRRLAQLMPATPYFPDFLTPAGQRPLFEEGLETVLATPVTRLRIDLGRLSADYRRPPSWFATLAGGEAEVLDRFGDAVRGYHDTVLAPYTRQLTAAVDADLSRRSQAMAMGGVDRLLSGLHPAARWDPPVLSVDYVVDRDLYLDGRGLLLIPVFFGVHGPITLADESLSPTLVYPVERAPFWELSEGRTDHMDALSELLGPTRAAALHLVGDGLTTTALAKALGVSVSAASRHATALRRAGLIHTTRHGRHVLHIRSRLGEALFKGELG
ncbi:Helix-turn-helix domain-containing protein [Nonomuraea solani]|uniref:Helix-turn-helix domain-containing protein n=1 Tax=Nonomuraea solani TaxID=1144553 RepID=A0A1H5Z8B4_9ACTN|nr:helix-turn-helix domain-containing protein [Nonomuraea solani]SEG31867.1 Helix-turn-helix domain-containing protein [Nonomuraea solani]